MESRYVPGWYSLLASLGALIGALMVFFGLLVLVFAYLPAIVITRYLGKSVPELIAQIPLWIGGVMILLGGVCYAWGHGMQRFRDWAPIVAAVFILELGLYVAMFFYLAYLGKIPGVRPLAEVMRNIGMSDWVKWVLMLCPVLALFLVDLGLLRSERILALYASKYEGWPLPLPICSNIQCRVVLPGPGARCPRCEPEYIHVRLVPLTADGEPRRDLPPIDLKFAPGRERIRLSRRIPDEPPEDQTVYFDVEHDELYAGISAPHAVITYDGDEGQFFIEDLDSMNHTYVDGRVLSPREPTLLPHMSEVQLGAAAFRFKIEYDEVEGEG